MLENVGIRIALYVSMTDNDNAKVLNEQDAERNEVHKCIYGEAFANSGFGRSLLTPNNQEPRFVQLPAE